MTVAIKDKTNYMWEDGTNDDIVITMSVVDPRPIGYDEMLAMEIAIPAGVALIGAALAVALILRKKRKAAKLSGDPDKNDDVEVKHPEEPANDVEVEQNDNVAQPSENAEAEEPVVEASEPSGANATEEPAQEATSDATDVEETENAPSEDNGKESDADNE